MQIINTYLNFNGNCEEAFDFYATVFGTEPTMKAYFRDLPADIPGPKADPNSLMHITLPIKNGSELMGCDVPEGFGQVKVGSSFHLMIVADSQEEADSLFAKLSDGGKVTMPMGQSFWGSYFGMCEDKFGIRWMFSFGL